MTERLRALDWIGLSLMAVLAASVLAAGCAPSTGGGFDPGARGGIQPPPGPSVYEIITRLELEPEQLPAVRAVLEDAEDAREEIQGEIRPQDGGRTDPSAMSEMRERRDAARGETERELASLLTSGQMVEYREMMREAERQREEMRSQMGGRRGAKGGRPGGGW